MDARSPHMCDRTNSPHKRFFFLLFILDAHIYSVAIGGHTLSWCVRAFYCVRSPELSRKQYFLPLHFCLHIYASPTHFIDSVTWSSASAHHLVHMCVVNMHNYSAALICRCHKTLRPHLLPAVKFNNTAHFSQQSLNL